MASNITSMHSGRVAMARNVSSALTLPFVLFAIPAGLLADRFSRRVLMASAEALRALALLAILVLISLGGMTLPLLALLGFWLGTHGDPRLGAWIVLSTVFLMGTHSAFFVPAK